MPPKPKEFEIIFFTDLDIDSCGIKFIEVITSGLSKFKVGGRFLVFNDINEKTASTAPAAPKPGIRNCVKTSAVVPAIPSGSTPSFSLSSLAASVTSLA